MNSQTSHTHSQQSHAHHARQQCHCRQTGLPTAHPELSRTAGRLIIKATLQPSPRSGSSCRWPTRVPRRHACLRYPISAMEDIPSTHARDGGDKGGAHRAQPNPTHCIRATRAHAHPRLHLHRRRRRTCRPAAAHSTLKLGSCDDLPRARLIVYPPGLTSLSTVASEIDAAAPVPEPSLRQLA